MRVLATANEVHKEYGIGRDGVTGEQAMDGFYRIPPGGKIQLEATLPWKLGTPGIYQIETRLERGLHRSNRITQPMEPPPMVVKVVAPDPAAIEKTARGKSVDVLHGRVLDRPDGSPVPNAKVVVWSAWTFNRQFVQTDAKGVYTFVPDAPGPTRSAWPSSRREPGHKAHWSSSWRTRPSTRPARRSWGGLTRENSRK